MLTSTSFVSSFARVVSKATLLEGAFAFADRTQVAQILAKYPADKKAAAIIPLLHLAQSENGWISRGAIEAVSKEVNSPVGRVHETASFYSMFRFAPPAKHIVEICRGLTCYIKGGDQLMKVLEKETGGTFKDGKSKDGLFNLFTSECLGACANAPVMVIDGVYYQDLTEKRVKEIIRAIKKGKKVEQYDAIHTPPAKPLK